MVRALKAQPCLRSLPEKTSVGDKITEPVGCQRDLELVLLQVGGRGQMGTSKGLHLLGGPAGRNLL